MVDIEPFKYQASTNIKEHNEIVDKVNEIVGVINDINLDGLDPRLTADEANIKKNTDDITHLKISDTEHTAEISTLESNVDNHAREITTIKAVDAKQNSDISEMNTVVDALTKELPTEITLYRDGTGKIKVQVTKEDNTTFDSNTLDMVIPYQYSIISGTSARSFKLDITTTDGNHIITNDFLIPEGGGTDITVTSVTLIKDPTNSNKVKVSIGLSDGTPLESGYVEMVNAVSGTFANNKLTITVNGVSSVPITIDTTGAVYSAGTGIKIVSGAISIDDTVAALKSDISDMETKTNANAIFETKVNAAATYATKAALNELQNQVGDAFSAVAVGTDGKSLDFTALDGQVNNIELPSFSPYKYSTSETIDLKTESTRYAFFDSFEKGKYIYVGTAYFKGVNTTWETDGYTIYFNGLELIRGGKEPNHQDDYLTNGYSVGIIEKDYGEFPTRLVSVFNSQGYHTPYFKYISNYGNNPTRIDFSAKLNVTFINGIWIKIS